MKIALFATTLAITSTFAFCNARKSSDQDSSSDGKSNTRRGKKKNSQNSEGFLKSIPMGGSVAEAAKDTFWLCPNSNLEAYMYTMTGGPRASWVKDGNIVDIKKIPLIDAKVTMENEFCVDTSATQRRMHGNGIPNHKIGTFPIPKDDPAYPYYAALPDPFGCVANGAEIPAFAYTLDITVPRFPTYNEEPTCMKHITTGVAIVTGAVWHLEYATDANDHPNDPATLLPYDDCWGHPVSGAMHYHGLSWKCFPNQGSNNLHSPLFGHALDGFGIYGPRSEHGKLVTNKDLDECHGHIHEIMWEGKKVKMFHYHLNREFPYSIGCFRGTPVKLIENLATCDANELSVTSVNTMTEASFKTTCLGGNRKVTKE